MYNCIDSVDCTISGSTPKPVFQISTYYDKCVEYIDVEGGGIPSSGLCLGITYVEDCFTLQCCILRRNFCYDNGVLRFCELKLTGPGSTPCSGNASFTPPNGCNILRRTGCIPRCQ